METKKRAKITENILVFLIRVSLIIAIALSAYEFNWIALFVSSLALILSFIPYFVDKKYNIKLPKTIQTFIVLFIYTSIFLGEVRNFYHKFWWWDSVLHFFSGIALGFVGFLILYVLYKTGKFTAKPIWIAIFAFCFAMALGGLWEIFEFAVDQFFGADMQKARGLCEGLKVCDSRLGVMDTMYDLILDAIGALIASIAGFIYLKKDKIFFFGKLIKDFEKENEQLFKK